MSIFLLGAFLVLMFLGIPIAISLGVSSVATIVFFTDLPISLVIQSMFTSMNSFIMLSVPLFILAGSLMDEGRVAEKIYNLAHAAVGWIYGGLGHVAILSNIIFGAMSGSAIAAMASIGKMSTNELVKKGYPKEYGTAIALSGSMLATIIPPSILMVVAAAVANVSVGRALLGGLIPGVIMGLAFMIYNYVYCKRHKIGEKSPFSWRELAMKTVIAIPALLVPVILLSGMFTGFFTPTEAAAVAVVYTILISVYVYKGIKWKAIPSVICNTAKSTGSILFIAITAKPAAMIFELDGLPQKVGVAISSISTNTIIIMLVIFVFLMLVGMFMDATAAIYILVPILLPAVTALGVDPVYFIVFLVISLSFGLITPPVGVCLYAAANVTNQPLETIVKASVPWMILIMCLIVSFIVFPQLITGPLQLLT